MEHFVFFLAFAACLALPGGIPAEFGETLDLTGRTQD